MLQLCFNNNWFWGGGRCENSEICIPHKCCDFYYNGQTGCLRHMFIYYQETEVGGGEKGDMNCCSFQDCALKISSQVALLKSIFGTRFPPPHTTPFFLQLESFIQGLLSKTYGADFACAHLLFFSSTLFILQANPPTAALTPDNALLIHL